MTGRIERDHGKAPRDQRRDERAELGAAPTPAVRQQHARPGAPRPGLDPPRAHAHRPRLGAREQLDLPAGRLGRGGVRNNRSARAAAASDATVDNTRWPVRTRRRSGDSS